ncbi:MAG: carboxymuconolactone decarboxylase family protein [Desulfovibrionales bacterium]
MDKLQEYDSIRKNSRKFLDLSPDVRDKFLDHYQASYKPGAIDAKTKRLMAMCGGLIAGCTGCIIGQLNMAVEEGATVQEILETCAVAMSLGGTLAWSQISMVVEYLEKNGMLEGSEG